MLLGVEAVDGVGQGRQRTGIVAAGRPQARRGGGGSGPEGGYVDVAGPPLELGARGCGCVGSSGGQFRVDQHGEQLDGPQAVAGQ